MNKSPCGMIICGDDVSVGKKGSLVGRRGLAAQIGVLKIMGAASTNGASFDELMSLGTAVENQIVSIAATLDHCHVPGRAEHAMLKEDEIELGTGPHNEPGYSKLSPVPSPEDFIGMILKYCLDEKDPERGYVHFEPDDVVVLMVSNFGGVSQMEMGALVDELLTQLERDYSMVPVRVYTGPLETSLNAPAFSTSVVNLTAAAKNTTFSVLQMLEFLDVRTNTQWESMAGTQRERRPRKDQFVKPPSEDAPRSINPREDLKGKAPCISTSSCARCPSSVPIPPHTPKTQYVDGTLMICPLHSRSKPPRHLSDPRLQRPHRRRTRPHPMGHRNGRWRLRRNAQNRRISPPCRNPSPPRLRRPARLHHPRPPRTRAHRRE